MKPLTVKLLSSNTRLESTIIVSNVERSQFKFFDLRVTLKKLCKLSIHFDTPFQKVIEERAAYDKMAKQNPKNGSAYTMEQRQRKG